MNTFQNPLAEYSAPDPFMTYDKATGYYYAMFTGDEEILLFRSKRAGDILKNGEQKVVYRATGTNSIYNHIWAPEMHKVPNGKWYLYSSSTYRKEDVENLWSEKRLFILESDTQDPFEGFHFKSRPDDSIYAIDPTVYTAKDGKQYICYSLCTDKQVLEIRELVNPYTFGEKRTVISEPTYDWEKQPPSNPWRINEGAFFIENDGRIFIAYSYNGCFCNEYGIALLEYVGGDLCEKTAWKKYDNPFFTTGNGVYGPGHATFFRSPSGRELWIAYHGMNHYNENEVFTDRYMHIQKIEFDKTGAPLKAIPVGCNVTMTPPDGENS